MSDGLASPILSPDSSISFSQAFLALVRTHSLSALHQLCFFPALHQLISFSNKYTQVSPSLEKKNLSTQVQPHIPSLSSLSFVFCATQFLKIALNICWFCILATTHLLRFFLRCHFCSHHWAKTALSNPWGLPDCPVPWLNPATVAVSLPVKLLL